MPGVWTLGLTGGIGSGKSTVAQMFGARGAAVIDADAIARGVTASGGAAIAPLAQAFGHDLITPDGALHRERMRALAFADPEAKRRLEGIVHPLVALETDQQAEAAIAAGRQLIVFDVPLLVESGDRWRRRVNRVLVVDCPVETQVTRVVARSALPPGEVERIIGAQATRAQRLATADMVIYNHELPLAALQAQVAVLASHFGL